MTGLSRFAVDNKRAVVFSALLLATIGFYLIFQIPQDVFPSATFPRIAVLVDHGFAPLKQMEMEVVKPIEEAVMGVPGVRVVRSTTSRGSAEINVDFQWNEDMFQAYQLVQAQVSGVRNQLPAGVQIEVRRFTSSTYPVAGYSLYSDRLDLVELNDLAVYTIRPQLTSISGINNVEVMGGHRREYWVNLDPGKLAAANLDHRQVSEALAQTNTVQFVGRLNEFNKLYLNIADNRYLTIDDVGKTVVANHRPTPIHLADIATIEPAVEENFISCVSNRHPAVLFTIITQPGANAVAVMRAVEQRLQEIRPALPPEVEMQKWYDMTDFVRHAIGSVRDSIILGSALTVIILLLFLRRFRITLVTATIIPVALLITFILIKLIGMNLSLMSLGGLAAAIGILVDNAIVVVENIERFLEEGHSRTEAVVQATGEIISPLLGATLTTLVVFVPLVFLSGVPGIFFRALALTLSLATAVSMLLAMFLTPALAAVFISAKKVKPGRVLPRIIAVQQKALTFSLQKPLPVLLFCGLLAAVSVACYLRLPSGFLPEWDESTIVLDYLAPPGSSLEGTKSMLQSIEDYLVTLPEVNTYSLRTGRSLAHPRTHANDGDFVIYLKPGHQRSSFEVMDDLRAFIAKKEPRLEPELFQVLPDRLNDLSGEIAPIVVKVFGNNLTLVQEVATQIADSLEHIPGVVDVFPGFAASEPELTIRIIPEAASRYGLSVEEINRAVHTALWGEESTTMMQGLKIIPVRVRYAKTDYNHLEKIQRLPIYLPQLHRMLPLEEVAEIRKVPGQTDVDHENLSQVVNVKAHISGRDLGSIIADVQRSLAAMHLPPGVNLQLGGQYESQQQAFKELLLILGFGILLVFTILLFEFRSFRTAAIIMFGTVLSVSGVFLLLLLTGIPLDISAFMGMIMIIGVVVNNGILLIDFTEKSPALATDVAQALLDAGRVRLRPIMMTTAATIFGFLPLAFALGEGAEMLQPLAVAMIGGMLVSMPLSLLVIPTLYYLVNRDKKELAATTAA
ncbi:MAG: efflux RND transporter permease subunit [candidate division KSB1 bacterium]|nr:efflux RND transporter permease subunit [candidate division KSB1 bacterium]MDZ7302191.1 efflux RND transporter permease subunit [candidate division KSB1 bacterium]MDZ7311300.1 efflux RND transporter permease subunit [candidate division KSB1 bacterium]